MGRKKIDIDWKIVDEKLSNFCEGTEIAAHLGITEDTLYNRVKEVFNLDFSAYKAQKRAKGELELRELQLQSAKDGNVTMQIWLGKQYLKQSDKQEFQGNIKLDELPFNNDFLHTRRSKYEA